MSDRRKKSTTLRLLAFIRPNLPFLVLALLMSVVQIVATLFAPVVVGDAIDYIVGVGDVDFGRIFFYIMILLGLIAAAVLFQWLATLCTNRVAYRTVRDLRAAAFKKINSVPLKYIDAHSHGDIISRVSTDIDLVSDGLIQGFTQMFSGIVTIAGTICFMFALNWKVSLVVILVTPLSLFVAYFIARGCHNKFRDQAIKRGEMTGLTEEMLSGQRTVKAYGYEKRAEARFEEINLDLKKIGTKAMFYSSMTNPSTRVLNGIVYAAVAIMGAVLCVQGSLTVGQLSCFLSYANQYTKPFNEISGVVTELQNAGFEVYIEGECIRESVMGRSPYGWDLITDAGIDQMKELFPEAMVLSEKYQILRFEYIEEMPGKDGETEESGIIIDLGRYRTTMPAGGAQDRTDPGETAIKTQLAAKGFTIDAIAENQNEIVDPFGGRDDVSRPTMYYYILLRTKSGNTGKSLAECSSDELMCAAFVRSHNTPMKVSVSEKEMMSVSDLEKITGFTYFASVPNAPKDSFKASDWGL